MLPHEAVDHQGNEGNPIGILVLIQFNLFIGRAVRETTNNNNNNRGIPSRSILFCSYMTPTPPPELAYQ